MFVVLARKIGSEATEIRLASDHDEKLRERVKVRIRYGLLGTPNKEKKAGMT